MYMRAIYLKTPSIMYSFDNKENNFFFSLLTRHNSCKKYRM